MTIAAQLQAIAGKIGEIPGLRESGLAAFVEGSGDLEEYVAAALHSSCGLAAIVQRPARMRNIGWADGRLAIDADPVVVTVHEVPALSRDLAGHVSAHDAAERIALALHSGAFHFSAMSQRIDGVDGIGTLLTVELSFKAYFTIG